jgi:hypothetical protein
MEPFMKFQLAFSVHYMAERSCHLLQVTAAACSVIFFCWYSIRSEISVSDFVLSYYKITVTYFRLERVYFNFLKTLEQATLEKKGGSTEQTLVVMLGLVTQHVALPHLDG